MTHKHTHEYFHITRHAKRYDHKTNTFTFNITYETATSITPRTLTVAEAFGLGIDNTQKHVLYDNINIHIKPTDIVLITGDSGTGKSALLKAIKHDLNTQATDPANISKDETKPIIETLGKTFTEALALLSKVGLNDATLLLKRYCELSDGQKHRYHIAKLLETSTQWWITDEFCSLLDRDTAKTVAYNTQKHARQQHKAFIAATAHTDLTEDLNPNVHIHKQFGKQVTITYNPHATPRECSLTREMHITRGTYNDYKQLSQYHYRSTRCPPPRTIFTLKRKNETCGVIVYSYPPPTTFGRSHAWKGTFTELQQQVSSISRVIIHPKYRTIGLGVKLIKETLPKAGTQHVETVAVMAKYNPFFEKAGMQKIHQSTPSKHVQNALAALETLGFNPALLSSTNHNQTAIAGAGRENVIAVLQELSKHEGSLRKRLMASGNVYPTHTEFTTKIRAQDNTGLAATLKRLSILAQQKVYLFWSKKQTKKNERENAAS